MANLHLLTAQTDSDKKRLQQNLKAQKKDFQLELIIFTAIWLIAPFFTNRPGQKPLIESMSYGMALLFFGAILVIPLLFTFFKVHKAVLACQSDLKRIIITQVIHKRKNPLFHKDKYCLELADAYLRKLYFPKHTFGQFETGETIRVEISENAKQVIKITKATEGIITSIQRKTPATVATTNPYWSVLFQKNITAGKSPFSFFSFFIPSKQHFISTIILEINIVVFLLMLISGVSIYKPQVTDIIHWGGNIRMLTIEQQEYWRLLTNIFVHIGIIHLLMNAIGFILISIFIEQLSGRGWFLFLYLFTGLCASLTSIWWHSNVVSAGASGAIFGLYGFFLAILISADKKEREVGKGLIIMVSVFIGYNLLMGIKGNVDNAAHIGGLISGFAAGIVSFLLKRTKKANHAI